MQLEPDETFAFLDVQDSNTTIQENLVTAPLAACPKLQRGFSKTTSQHSSSHGLNFLVCNSETCKHKVQSERKISRSAKIVD